MIIRRALHDLLFKWQFLGVRSVTGLCRYDEFWVQINLNQTSLLISDFWVSGMLGNYSCNRKFHLGESSWRPIQNFPLLEWRKEELSVLRILNILVIYYYSQYSCTHFIICEVRWEFILEISHFVKRRCCARSCSVIIFVLKLWQWGSCLALTAYNPLHLLQMRQLNFLICFTFTFSNYKSILFSPWFDLVS